MGYRSSSGGCAPSHQPAEGHPQVGCASRGRSLTVPGPPRVFQAGRCLSTSARHRDKRLFVGIRTLGGAGPQPLGHRRGAGPWRSFYASRWDQCHPSPAKRGTSGYGRCRIVGMRLGIAHHLGWAVAVTASADYEVMDRRRIELIEPGVPTAPVHHEGGPHLLHRSAEPLLDDALAALVASVRASVVRATSIALDELTAASTVPIVSMSVRGWPANFPESYAVQRRAPYESRADSVMYCKVLAEAAGERGWTVHLYDAKNVEDEAAHVLGERANEVLHGPRARLGPPWSKDHRMALAATIVAA